MSINNSTARRGRLLAGAGVLALGVGAALVAAPAAQAAGPRDVVADSGSVSWGYKESFRRYVGNQTAALPPIGAVPVGERITLIEPGAFDTSAKPASTTNTSTPNETLPWRLPVTGGSVTSAQDLTVESAGGATFHFPSHYFVVTMENVSVDVTGTDAVVTADVTAEVTGDFGEWEAGTYGGEDVEFATGTADVALDGDAVEVALSGLTTTADGAAALPLYAAGDPLDDLSLTADVAPEQQTWTPAVTLSKQSGFDPAATGTLTVTGSGYDPAANVNNAGRPPVAAGQPAGVYVVFGKFAETWRPSDGAASSARKVVSQKWALPEPSYSQVKAGYPNVADQLVLMNPDGTFTADLDVKVEDSVAGVYGVYTYAAGGAAANAAQEVFAPVGFTTPDGEGGEDVDIDVNVPEKETDPDPEPGEFSWTIASTKAISLGTAVQGDAAFTASGALHKVTVTDTRPAGTWNVSGKVGDFVAGSRSFGGSALGWSPSVTGNTGGVQAGAVVRPGVGAGLTSSSTLASAAAGHEPGSVAVDAGLDLSIPLDTPAGDYTGVLTLTAIG